MGYSPCTWELLQQSPGNESPSNLSSLPKRVEQTIDNPCWPKDFLSHLAGIEQEKNNLRPERTYSDLLQYVLRWKLLLFIEVFSPFVTHTSVISLGRTGLEISVVIFSYFRTVWLISMHLLNTAGQPTTVWFFFSAISLLSDLLGRTVNLLNDNVNMLSGNFAWFGEKGGCVLRFCVCSSERLEIPPGKKKAKLLIHFLGKISSFCPLRGLSHTSGVVRTCRVKKHQQWCSGTKGWVCHYS